MSSIYKKPGATLKLLQDLSNGLSNHPPPGPTQIVAGGKISTIAEVVVEMKHCLDIYQAAENAAKEYEKAIQARDALALTIAPRLEEILSFLKSTLGKRNPDLSLYGIKPAQKPTPLTAEQLTLRNAKAKATRLARHTLGSRQKKAIKGQLPTPPIGGQTPPPAAQ